MALDDEWMPEAKCLELDPDEADRIFFPKSRKGIKADYSEAKAICFTCPVRKSCLVYAIAHGVPQGCWGGMSPDERKRMDRAVKVAIRKTWWRLHPLSRSTR